ncbi:hypothetical protein GAY28_03740 [Azospirillum brasilense]|nr:hypothetical protein [Azospirillum brasilense]
MKLLQDPQYSIPMDLLAEYAISVEDAIAIEEGQLQRSDRRVSPGRRKTISDKMAIDATEALLAPLRLLGGTVRNADLPGRSKQIGFDYLLERGHRRLHLQVKGSSQVDYLGWQHKRNNRGEIPGMQYDLLLLVDTGVACPAAVGRLDPVRFPTVGRTAEFYLFTVEQVRRIIENPERWNTSEVWIGAWRNKHPGAGTKEYRRQYQEIWTPLHRNAFSVIERGLGL